MAHVHFGGAFGSVQYYTSHSYKPVREVAASCETGAATNIIYGLALGMLIDRYLRKADKKKAQPESSRTVPYRRLRDRSACQGSSR